jgi:tRNA threonylcarbamoyladenosine biosynthesis protein TsaB
MIYILNIETSTKNCSVSIAQNGENIAIKEMANEGYSHAEFLHVFIEKLLEENGLKTKDLHAIAVSQGPGSYTGLRIGVSAAKGLCFAVDIPLIAVETLTVLAHQVNVANGLIIPMVDARRMEVYSAIFNSKLEKTRVVEAQILDETTFLDINETIYILGDCQEKIKTVLTDKKFVFLKVNIFPSAKEMSALSFEKYKNNDFVDVAYFEPYYLKDFMVTKSTK